MSTHPWFLDTQNYPRRVDVHSSGRQTWRDRLYGSYARSRPHPGKLRFLGLMEKLLRIREAVVVTDSGLMRLDNRDYLQRVILLEGCFERETLELMRRILKPGDTYVDVGANIGQHALWGARCVLPGGRVLAVEPNPDSCHRLLINRRLNGLEKTMEVAALALSDAPDILRFELPPFWNTGLSRQLAEGQTFLGLEQLTVACATLSDLCRSKEIFRIALLKIDTEGSELRVFQGLFADKSIACENIIFEYMPSEFSYGEKPEDYLALLRGEGYEICEIDGELFQGGAPAIESNLWARKRDDFRGCRNSK
jgi:FkbM family methyltransferase